eukprot:359522-Chlamydomonas_euryale.AAC.10
MLGSLAAQPFAIATLSSAVLHFAIATLSSAAQPFAIATFSSAALPFPLPTASIFRNTHSLPRTFHAQGFYTPAEGSSHGGASFSRGAYGSAGNLYSGSASGAQTQRSTGWSGAPAAAVRSPSVAEHAEDAEHAEGAERAEDAGYAEDAEYVEGAERMKDAERAEYAARSEDAVPPHPRDGPPGEASTSASTHVHGPPPVLRGSDIGEAEAMPYGLASMPRRAMRAAQVRPMSDDGSEGGGGAGDVDLQAVEARERAWLARQQRRRG